MSLFKIAQAQPTKLQFRSNFTLMQTPIVPVSYGPLGTANTLYLRGVGPVNDSGCPHYFYDIQRVTEITPPTEPPTFNTVSITVGNAAMTAAQWSAWPSGNTPAEDETYQLGCLAEILGLTPVVANAKPKKKAVSV
jgi:hypothetical protein